MSIPVSYDSYRPKVCSFFAGRAWYAGIPSGEKLAWVMFSQVLDDISNITKCHQANDPTSEVFSDIQDSDGGVIQIPDAGEIVHLIPLGRGLLVFGANGVWSIVGGDNGFTAASYNVEKVTSSGCLFQKTIVKVEDSIFYWSSGGIFVIQLDTTGLASAAKNISDASIKTLYNSIPSINRIHASGQYNESEKTVEWLYNNSSVDNSSEGKYIKNKTLVFNTQLGCFYTLSIDDSAGPLVMAGAVTKEILDIELSADVLVGTEEVLSNTDEVVANLDVSRGTTKQFKYLTVYPVGSAYSTTFSDKESSGFVDWYSYNSVGVELDSFVLTGYNMGGVGPARAKTVSYVNVFMERTGTTATASGVAGDSGCLMQTRWDFTNNDGPGKWGTPVQVYKILRPYFLDFPATFDNGYPLVITKNKVRGRGKALQIKFSSEAGKDMKLVGWSTGFVGNTNV